MALRNKDREPRAQESNEIDFKKHVELGENLRKLSAKMQQALDIVLDEDAKKLYSSRKKDFEKGKKDIKVKIKGKEQFLPRTASNVFYLENIIPALSGGTDQFFLLNNYGVPAANELDSLGFSYKTDAEENDLEFLLKSAQEIRKFRKKLTEFLEKWSKNGFSLKVSVKNGEFDYEQSPSSLDGEKLLAEFDEIVEQMVE